MERLVIEDALNYFHQNRTHTAKALGISLRTIRNKIASYNALRGGVASPTEDAQR